MRVLRFAFLATTISLTVPGIALAAHPVRHGSHSVARADTGIIVPMDEAKVVSFEKPIATVFVGNTVIADVTIIDSRHVYVLGKTFGVTNMIGLDIDHNPVFNRQITIANRTAGAVTVTRGPESYNYSCTRVHCETNPRPGDPQTWFTNTEGSTNTHEEAASKSALAQTGSSATQ